MTDLSREELLALKQAQREELERRVTANPVRYFRWHAQQRWFLFEAPRLVSGPIRVMNLLGGNRGGKSATGKGLMSDILRRNSPLNEQFTTTDPITGEVRVKDETDPLRIWIIPPTKEKGRSDWAEPADGLGVKYWMGDLFREERKSPDHVFYTIYGDEVWMKSQDQAKDTFESSEVDLALVDEEWLDEAKVNSVLMRLGTCNGVLVNTFTPLNGLSWSWRRWWKPLIEEGRATPYGDRRWIYEPEKGSVVITVQVGMADNPKARSYAEEVEADPEMSEAEKAARLHGEYGFVEGALFPKLAGLDLDVPRPDQQIYVVNRLPGETYMKNGERKQVPGSIFRWYLVADPNKSYGAVLGCMDHDDNLFFVASHLEEGWSDMQHVEAFKEIEKKYVRDALLMRYADPGGAGAHSIVNLSKLGMPFMAIEKPAGSVSTSIKRLRGMTYVDPDHHHPITGEKGAPRIYFYRPGLLEEDYVEGGKKLIHSPLCEQLSMARQSDKENDPPDTPHKDIKHKLDLFDCARYMAMLASAAGGGGGKKKIHVVRDNHRLPVDSLLKQAERAPDELPFFAPTYGDVL